MRRHSSADGQLSVWACAEVRPDPCNLPAEYHASAMGRGNEQVECEKICIDREEVSFGVGRDGMRVPMSQYLGVAMAVAVSGSRVGDDCKAAVIVVLEHDDPALNVPLFVAWDSDDVVAIWHAWARELRVPLRIRGTDGTSNQINEQMGNVSVFSGTPRRNHPLNGRKRGLARTLRRSSTPLAGSNPVNRIEKAELFARQ